MPGSKNKIAKYNYEKFFELSMDLTCILGTDGYVKKINRHFLQVFQYKEVEVLNQSFLKFVAEEDFQATSVFWKRLINGEPLVNFENHCVCKDGSKRLLEWTAVLSPESQLLYAVGRDITAKRENQEEFLEAILDNIPDMIFVKEAKELRFVRLNRAGEELLGVSKNELIGKNDYDLFPNEEADFFTQKDREVINQRGVLEIPREPIETKLKGKRILHTKKIPIFGLDGGPTYLVGISEDITEKLEAQEASKLAFEEQVARKETERSLRERDEFISIASHELKTPLSSLKLQAQIFRRNAQRDPAQAYTKEQVDKLLELTEKQVTRLVRLVDDMLDVSRIRTGRLSMEWSEFDLCELIRDVLERSKSQFESAGIAAPKFITTCQHLKVFWDRIRIEQVLMNLLTNAIRYGDGKEVEVHLERRGELGHFSVIDHGKGIPENMLELVFDRFKRALTYNETTGLGLGLFISKQIVTAHKGTIWAESQLGQGSVFHVEIPLRPIAE